MKSSFQTAIVIIFCAAFVVAVVIFSGIFSSDASRNSSTPQGNVSVWGTLDMALMQQYLDQLNAEDLGYNVTYSMHEPGGIVADLTNALADGNPPDLVIYPSELMRSLENRFYPIPFEAYNERLFRDSYVDGAQVFLSRDGILGIPLFVDPLVTYYNKTILAGQSFVRPPATWEEFVQSVPLFTRRDGQGNISQSAIALGESQNIPHFSDILSALFLQTGNPIVRYEQQTGAYRAVLTEGPAATQERLQPTAQALAFYTDFANPTSAYYSWNRSLPDALAMFISGRSAFYLGRASELFEIQERNPNLDFDVQELFQLEGAVRPVSYGSYMAVSMLRAAPNPTAAYAAYGAMTRPADTDFLSKLYSLPPARRDLLQTVQQDPYVSVFFRAALNAYSWPSPNPGSTDAAFRAMISSVSSGVRDETTAINEANRDIQAALR